MAYTGSADFPELFKYSDQKNTNLETALLSISTSFKDNSVPITQELLAAIMATLDKEVGSNYLPIEENGDYGMGTDCTYKVSGSCRSTSYAGGVDYKGRGYIQITGKSNYQTYCGSDCVGTSSPELDVCGCKNQWQCTVTDAATCPQVKALQPDYAAKIFALYYVDNNWVSLSNSKHYWDVGKAINGGDAYASDFGNIANAYLTLFSDNPDKTSSLLAWLNSGIPAASEGASVGSPVTLTLYIHDGNQGGPIIQDAAVTGHDGSGNNFQQTTDSSGSVTITGTPGTWSLSASASGYATNSWSQSITGTCTKHASLQTGQPQEYTRTNEYVDNSSATDCTPGSKSAKCSSQDACVNCDGKCVSSGTDVGRGWSCNQGKWDYNPQSLSDLGAYRATFTVKYDSDASMKIANKVYEKGIQLYECNFIPSNSNHIAYFNLDSKYSRLTGFIGLDDKSQNGAKTKVYFGKENNELIETFNLTAGDLPIKVDLDVSGIQKFIVVEPPDGCSAYIDLIDMSLEGAGRPGADKFGTGNPSDTGGLYYKPATDQDTEKTHTSPVDVHEYAERIGPGGDLSGVPPGMG